MYQQAAVALERAKSDLFTFADTQAVSTSFGGTLDVALRTGEQSTRHDPVPLICFMAAVTKQLGFAATLSSTFYPPFQLARLMATVDHLTGGRIGWNVVTSSNPQEFENFGYRELLDHDERYERAEEYMELCYQLWGSSGTLTRLCSIASVTSSRTPLRCTPSTSRASSSRCRGPLNVVSSPQVPAGDTPAGASPRGKDFAAKHAEAIIVNKNELVDMKDFYDDVKGRMVKFGRNPDDCKIFFTCNPTIAETEAAALHKREALAASASIEAGLAKLSTTLAVDLTQFDLDQPLPAMEIQGIRGKQEQYYAHGRQPRFVRWRSTRPCARSTRSGKRRTGRR